MSDEPMKFKIKLVHIESVVPGDLIVHRGKVVTICRKDIKHSTFLGVSIFGDSYKLGHKAVSKVTFE